MATETKPSAGEDAKMDLFEDDDEFEEFEISEGFFSLRLAEWYTPCSTFRELTMASGSKCSTENIPKTSKQKTTEDKRNQTAERLELDVKSLMSETTIPEEPLKSMSVPKQTKNIQEQVTEISRKLQEEMDRPKQTVSLKGMVPDEVMAKYSKLKRIGTGKTQKDEWKDSNLKTREHINVKDWFNYDRGGKEKLLSIALSSLTKAVSAQSVATILVCAWGLRSCEDPTKYIFQDRKTQMTKPPTKAESLEQRTICEISGGKTYSYDSPRNSEFDEANYQIWERSGTYICAALLRLVVREETNMRNAWKYIKQQYKGFYQEDIWINLNPNLECLTAIRQLLQSRTILKDTVAVFLLAFVDLKEQDRGLCQMLYASQMSYTGMHSYSLLLSNADKMGVPVHVLIASLDHPSSEKALETIMMLLTVYEFPETDEEIKKSEAGKTWKYSRIFDQEAFAFVQTKNCIMLTTILALISEKLGAQGVGDVTKIRQIAKFAETHRDWLDEVVYRIVKYCLTAAWVEDKKMSHADAPEN